MPIKCECEDGRHFCGLSHDYGKEVTEVVKVNTEYGRFWVCRDCEQSDHMIPTFTQKS